MPRHASIFDMVSRERSSCPLEDLGNYNTTYYICQYILRSITIAQATLSMRVDETLKKSFEKLHCGHQYKICDRKLKSSDCLFYPIGCYKGRRYSFQSSGHLSRW